MKDDLSVSLSYEQKKQLIESRHIDPKVYEYLKNKEDIPYTMPEDVIGVLVNPITGSLATNQDKNKRIVYYIKGTEPK